MFKQNIQTILENSSVLKQTEVANFETILIFAQSERMRLDPPITLAEAAKILNCEYIGPENHQISGINEIHRVVNGDLTFVDVEKYFEKALNSAANTILINKKIDPPTGKGLLFSDDPFRDFNILTEHFQPRPRLNIYGEYKWSQDVHVGQNVTFGQHVSLGNGTEIGHNSVIGSNVTIGENTLIYPNVTIYDNTTIGNNCCIQSGTVIGSEAFYFKARSYGRDKMLSKGRVEIEDFVEIGSNCTIDRGVSSVTFIGEHTKLDNLIQIGHDTVIGKRCMIAAQVGIAGCVNIEEDVVIWGQAGIVSDVTIHKKAVLLAKTGVMEDLPGHKVYGGMIADEAKAFMRKEAVLRRLIKVFPEIESLMKR